MENRGKQASTTKQSQKKKKLTLIDNATTGLQNNNRNTNQMGDSRPEAKKRARVVATMTTG